MSLPFDQQRTQSGNSIFENVYIYGKLEYDFTKDVLDLDSINVTGNSVFTGLTTFIGDIDINSSLTVDILSARQKLEVGIGGSLFTVLENGNTGIGKTDPEYKLDIDGSVNVVENIIVNQNIGIGSTSPEQRLDVAGSIKIDDEIYDSTNSPGDVGAFLTKDGDGIRWVNFEPSFSEGIFVYNDEVLVGLTSFSGLNLVAGNSFGSSTDTVQASVNSNNASIADIFVYDYWGSNASGNIYRNSKVGINNSTPTADLDVTGSVEISETLNVGGNTTLESGLDVDGTTTLNAALDVDGITTLNAALDVDGATTLNNTLDVDGTTTLNAALDVDGATTLNSTLDVDGNTTLNSSLDVDGATTLNSSLDVDGTTTLNAALDVDGATTLNNTLDVDGNTTLNAGLDVDGATTLNSSLDVDGATTLNSTLDVDGLTRFNNTTDSTNPTNGSVQIDGGVGIVKRLNVGESVDFDDTLTVDGATSLNSTLQVGVGGTVITTTGIGSVGFGSVTPSQDVDFNKDVRFQKAIYDTNNEVGFKNENYQVPRNVLTSVGVDTSGNIIGGRFYDAANLIRLNLDFIANEAVGFLTSTDYKNPAFELSSADYTSCKDDIKDILKAVTYDITRGGNSRCVGAGLSYYNGSVLQHITGTDVNGYSIKDATIVAITTAAQVSRYVINNLPPTRSYQGVGNSISLIRDLSLQDDPDYSSNIDPDGCANVVSAITVCAGIVTTIIGSGPSAAPNINNPNGKIVWSPAGADAKNIIYVTKYGNDDNNGRTEGSAKLTIGAAAEIAQPGDTIMVRSGVYAENNPIGLRTDVSVVGQDLRLVTIYPQNNDDVFYVRRGCLIDSLSFAYSKDPYDDVAPINITAAAVAFPPPVGIGSARSGFLDPGPCNEGPSGRWRSPYIRNCTNFMTDSIGMKIDGDHVSAAFTGTNNLGQDLKCMVCDSFTQYNQNGIGVSVTNKAYAQLVSIFTINCNIGIFAGSGGQCDITNSNSSFGNYGLYADGTSGDEFTGITTGATVSAEEDTYVFYGVKDSEENVRKPFDGQGVFFKINLDDYPDTGVKAGIVTEPLRVIRSIRVTDGGSGYSAAAPPNITISEPLGPEGILAELSANVDADGTISSIDVISSGRNFLPSGTGSNQQDITITISGSGGATAEAITDPILYTVNTATEPSILGITTVTFNEFVPYSVNSNVGVSFRRLSRIITSSHSFEYIGAGTDINRANPFQGGVPIPENEVVAINGGQIPFTSTDQKGNFRIGEGLTIDQTTSTISGRDFTRAIQANLTPLILALGR